MYSCYYCECGVVVETDCIKTCPKCGRRLKDD